MRFRIGTCGCAGLAVRLLDGVVARFDVAPLLGHASGSGWVMRQVLAGAAFAAIPLVLSALLDVGFAWRPDIR